MKKTLSLILAVMMLLGCMSVTAFAEETDNTTDITLTVAKALTYDMVIPEDVTNLNAAGVFAVGQAKVENVKNATDNTVISYTAETTAFKCEGKTDIPASYYTDLQGTNTFPITAVKVYENKKDAENIPTMYVGISTDAWDAAENGTYTATVTFNFEEEKIVENIEDVLKTISLPSASDFSGDDSVALADAITKSFINDNFESVIMYGDFDDDNKDELACILLGGNGNLTCELDNKVTKTANGYSLTENGITWDFAMNDDKVESITISGSDKANMNGVHKKRIRLADVLPDDFPKKTGENEPNNAWIEQNNNNQKLYIENVAGVDALHIGNTSKALMLYVGDKTGNNYEFKSFNNLTHTITLTMTDAGKLESITVSGFGDGKNGTYKAPVPVTVADLLSAVKDGLPTRWQESNWLNDKVIACLYKNSNTLTAYSNNKTATVSTSTVLTQDGNNYTYSDGTNTWTFIMEEETLTQITYSGTDDTAVLNGTYKILTVADLLATVEGFPTTYADSKWRNNQSHLYKDGDVLKAYNQGESQTVTVPCNTVLTMDAFVNAYGGPYNEVIGGGEWLFYMNDNKLTKVNYRYVTINNNKLLGDYAAPQPK